MQISHSYTYDALYRLTGASGTYIGADNKSASYTLNMGYDNMHRITQKSQHLSQVGVQFDGTLYAGYDLTYTYGSEKGKKFQLDNVYDINYRTEETPTESTNINNGHKYTYDLNGNLVYVNTSRVKRDGKKDEKSTEQKFRWDEENRLLAVDENGYVSNYWYDADGERTVKTSGENEAIYVNSEFSGGNTGTARFSLYVSPYLVAGQGGSLKDAADLSDTGDVVDRMNVIRKELNENNNNRFGQRLSHKSIIPTKDECVSFIPFDSSSLKDIRRGSNPPDDSKQIRIETPK